MDYKKEIIEMIEKITKPENIAMLYGVVKTMVGYEDQKEKKQGQTEWTITLITKKKLKNF